MLTGCGKDQEQMLNGCEKRQMLNGCEKRQMLNGCGKDQEHFDGFKSMLLSLFSHVKIINTYLYN